MQWLTPVTLTGDHVRLEPLSTAHHDGLCEAVRDGELWQLWYTVIPDPAQMRNEIQRRLDEQVRGTMCPFALIDPVSDIPVGMTTYMNIDAANRRLEIGSTWIRRSAQRTALNSEAKRLMLTHAFNDLGAKLDGVLRSHQINLHPDAAGALRDTCVYSIIAAEWPTVRANLDYILARPEQD